MKKRILLGWMLGLLMWLGSPTASKAQISIDVTAIQRLIELKNLVDKAKKQVSELQKGNTIENGTKNNTNGILKTGMKVEELLRTATDFLSIVGKMSKYSDVALFEKNAENAEYAMGNYIQAMEYDLNKVISAIQKDKLTQKSGMDLYDYIFAGRTAESAELINTLDDYNESKSSNIYRIYGLQTAMQKRKMQQALTYYKMAEELEKKANGIVQAVSGETKGTALSINSKSAFKDVDQSNSSSFDDPFNFGNTYNESAMSEMLQLQSGGSGSGGLLSAIGDLFTTGIGGKEIEIQVQNMMAKAKAESMKNAMASFQGGSGVNYSSFSNVLSGGIQTLSTLFGSGDSEDDSDGSGSGKSDGMRMTDGERVANQKHAIDLYVKALELREKGDALMVEATVRTSEQRYVDGVRERVFQRNALLSIKL